MLTSCVMLSEKVTRPSGRRQNVRCNEQRRDVARERERKEKGSMTEERERERGMNRAYCNRERG